jgi:hypothetical protein
MQYTIHTIVFSQLLIEGRNEDIDAFVCQIWDENGRARVADWIPCAFRYLALGSANVSYANQ